MFGKTIKFINIFVLLILKTLLKLLFLQACVTDKFILFIYLIVLIFSILVFSRRSVLSYTMRNANG